MEAPPVHEALVDGSFVGRIPCCERLVDELFELFLLCAGNARTASVCVVASQISLLTKSLNRSSTSSMTKASSLTIMQVAWSSVNRGIERETEVDEDLFPSRATARRCGHALIGSLERGARVASIRLGPGMLSAMRGAVSPARVVVFWVLVVGALGSCSAGSERAGGLPKAAVSPGVEPSASIPASSDGRFRPDRLAMVDTQIAARGVNDSRVLDAMRTVPRHEFVPREQMDRAYEDRALPIGEGQTISQPYIVALMTELLDVQAGEAVLEIGTGSGYQAAVAAELTDRVYTVEILPKLARRAASTLERLGYARVQSRNADGYFGWAEHGPYDGIIVTAAPDHIPAPLVGQLREGGRMVIPVGPPGSYQTLWRLTKQQGKVVSENITDVAFVPLVRKP